MTLSCFLFTRWFAYSLRTYLRKTTPSAHTSVALRISSSRSMTSCCSLSMISLRKSSTLRAYNADASDLATLVAADASALYARNVLDFLKLIIDKEQQLVIDREDEILKATLVCADGVVLRK